MTTKIRIKNWKLTLLGLSFVTLFTCLGFWQLSRAEQKKELIASFKARQNKEPVTAKQLKQKRDWRFYRATLAGHYDNKHTFLLDNKIVDKKIGYEIYTPFSIKNTDTKILIDRGFIQATSNRSSLPFIEPIIGEQTLTGILNAPPRYVALGSMNESKDIFYPLRVEYINIESIGKLLNQAIYPLVLHLKAKANGSFDVKWQVVTMPPEKHWAYALQWFAFAITLLILSIALGVSRRN